MPTNEDNLLHIYMVQDTVSGHFYSSGSRDIRVTKNIDHARKFNTLTGAKRAATIKKNKIAQFANSDSLHTSSYYTQYIEYAQMRMNIPDRGVVIKHWVIDPNAGEVIEQS